MIDESSFDREVDVDSNGKAFLLLNLDVDIEAYTASGFDRSFFMDMVMDSLQDLEDLVKKRERGELTADETLSSKQSRVNGEHKSSFSQIDQFRNL